MIGAMDEEKEDDEESENGSAEGSRKRLSRKSRKSQKPLEPAPVTQASKKAVIKAKSQMRKLMNIVIGYEDR